MKIKGYRGMPNPPVPFHAIDHGLAASMHAEIKVLHGLALSRGEALGITPKDTERAIAYRLLSLEGEGE
jgi:hypothetical protein